MSVEEYRRSLKEINNSLSNAIRDNDIDKVRQCVLHPYANMCIDGKIDGAVISGYVEIVEILMEAGASRVFLFSSLYVLCRKEEHCEIFTKFLHSRIWNEVEGCVNTMFRITIHNDNLAIFKCLAARYPLAWEHSKSAARIFSPKILAHMIETTTFSAKQARIMVKHLIYGYLATHKLGESTYRDGFVKPSEERCEEIIARYNPIYEEFLNKLKPVTNMTDREFSHFLTRMNFKALEAIEFKNDRIRESRH